MRFAGRQPARVQDTHRAARCKRATVQRKTGNAIRHSQKENSLRDLLFTLATIIFFVFSAGYVRVCERLK
jgi:hypothetical protein